MATSAGSFSDRTAVARDRDRFERAGNIELDPVVMTRGSGSRNRPFPGQGRVLAHRLGRPPWQVNARGSFPIALRCPAGRGRAPGGQGPPDRKTRAGAGILEDQAAVLGPQPVAAVPQGGIVDSRRAGRGAHDRADRSVRVVVEGIHRDGTVVRVPAWGVPGVVLEQPMSAVAHDRLVVRLGVGYPGVDDALGRPGACEARSCRVVGRGGIPRGVAEVVGSVEPVDPRRLEEPSGRNGLHGSVGFRHVALEFDASRRPPRTPV